MRPWLRLLIFCLLLAGVAVGAWVCVQRRRLARQWDSFRVGQAATAEEATAKIAAVEQAADRQERLRELVRKWGTGNQRFDLYLAGYVRGGRSSDRLRQTFSLEMNRRRELLPRWTHFWCWQTDRPGEQLASIVEYHDTLVAMDRPPPIPWREVLNLQAVFQLTDRAELARRLSPDNWVARYRAWQQTRPAKLPRPARPDRPFADWEGPPPAPPKK